MKAKEPRINVRVSPELKQRLESVVSSTGVEEAVIVRNCLDAVCTEVEQSGVLTFPLIVASKGNAAALARVAAGTKARTEYVITPRAAALNDPAKRK